MSHRTSPSRRILQAPASAWLYPLLVVASTSSLIATRWDNARPIYLFCVGALGLGLVLHGLSLLRLQLEATREHLVVRSFGRWKEEIPYSEIVGVSYDSDLGLALVRRSGRRSARFPPDWPDVRPFAVELAIRAAETGEIDTNDEMIEMLYAHVAG